MSLPQKTVYLAGPIVGLSYEEARHGWRDEFDRLLHDSQDNAFGWHWHIYSVSPMRGKDVLSADQVVTPGIEYLMTDPIENAKGILARDTNDIKNCDLVVANLLDLKVRPIGTLCELGIAHALGKPVCIIMEKEGSPVHHGFVTGIASFWVDNLPDAVRVAQTLLTPGL